MRDGRTNILLGLMAMASAAAPALGDVGEPINAGKYKYQMQIALSGYAGATTLTDLPLLVIFNTGITGFDYPQFKTGAADLRFASSTGVELAYQIEKWDTGGDSHVWVRVPSVSGSGTSISAFWGNPSDTTPAYTTNGATWDSNFAAVWHMTETSPLDSTSLLNHGTGVNTAGTGGLVADGQDFDGTAYVDINAVAADIPGTDLTYSLLFKTTDPDGSSSGHTLIGVNQNTFAARMRLAVGASAAGAGQVSIVEGADSPVEADSNTAVDDGVWHHLAYTRSGSVGTVYVDGIAKATHTANFPLTPASDLWFIGQLYVLFSPGRRAIGQIDEVRISKAPRSDDWIAACSKMMKSNGDFLDYGDVESVPVAGSVFFGW